MSERLRQNSMGELLACAVLALLLGCLGLLTISPGPPTGPPSAAGKRPQGPIPMPTRLASRRRPGPPAYLRRALRRLLVASALGLVAVTVLTVAPRFLGFPTMVVTGGSMGDSLPLGSVAVTRARPAYQVQTGDIVVVPRDGPERSLVAHRVQDILTENGHRVFATKGDANLSADPLPVVAQESGKVPVVVAHIPWAGYIVSFLQTPLGWALSVLLPSGILCLDLLRAIWSGGEAKHRGTGRPAWLRWAI